MIFDLFIDFIPRNAIIFTRSNLEFYKRQVKGDCIFMSKNHQSCPRWWCRGRWFVFKPPCNGTTRNRGRIRNCDIIKKRTEGTLWTWRCHRLYCPKEYFTPLTTTLARMPTLVVITAGAPQKPGETRLQLVDKNWRLSSLAVGFNC